MRTTLPAITLPSRKTPRVAAALLAAILIAPAAFGQANSNGFVSYQGKVESAGSPVTGPIAVQMRVFNALVGGTQIASRQVNNVAANNGLFSVDSDFGQAAFANQTDLWLEVAVQIPSGSGAFTTLTPRQRLTSSVFSMNTRGLRVDASGRVALGGFSAGATAQTASLNLANVGSDTRAISLQSTAGTERWSLNFGASNELSWRASPSGSPTTPALTLEFDNDIVFNGSTAPNPSGFGRVVSLVGNTTGNSSAAFVAQNVQVGSTWSFGVNTAGSFSFFKSGVGPNTVSMPVLQITGGSDIAEPYDVAPSTDSTSPIPGMVVSIDPDQVGKLRVADQPYDRKVAGIISGAHGVAAGLTLTQTGTPADGQYPVAKVGRVWVLADASAAPIQPGDQLTTSDTPGHAMKADPDKSRGSSIGKAMSRLDSGKGYVLVLVNLQ